MPPHDEYIGQMGARIRSTMEAVGGRSAPVTPGRKVPVVRALPIGTGRRLNASIMFLDLCGFSKRPSEDIDQQANILAALTVKFSEFIAIIEDFGGTVEKNTGDGLMAYFTQSSEFEQGHESRAVEAALYMFYAAKQLIDPVFIAANFQPFDFRITINSGPVTLAEVGAPRGFRGVVAIGTAANIASKMLGHAKANELVLGYSTALGLRSDWFKWVTYHSSSAEFVRGGTNEPYTFFAYTGRFK